MYFLIPMTIPLFHSFEAFNIRPCTLRSSKVTIDGASVIHIVETIFFKLALEVF